MMQRGTYIDNETVKLLVISSSIVLIILLVTIIVLYTIFQRRKISIIEQRNAAEKKYLKEVAVTQNEIRENTLKNLSWELHDNIGQLLSVAKMQLNILQSANNENDQITEINDVVGQSLQEVRSLSKGLNNDVISNEGLITSVQSELQRFQRLNFIEGKMEVSGIKWPVPKNDEIMLFRIIQEIFSNIVKHASASHLEVTFNFTEENLQIRVIDDGIGFEQQTVKLNSGLINMRARAEIVGATFNIESDKNKGTTLIICYPRSSSNKFNY